MTFAYAVAGCTFGNVTLQVGEQLVQLDPCVTCSCLTPPKITCTRQVCPPHPENGICKETFEPGRCCPVAVECVSADPPFIDPCAVVDDDSYSPCSLTSVCWHSTLVLGCSVRSWWSLSRKRSDYAAGIHRLPGRVLWSQRRNRILIIHFIVFSYKFIHFHWHHYFHWIQYNKIDSIPASNSVIFKKTVHAHVIVRASKNREPKFIIFITYSSSLHFYSP